jgi:hypothetical protein
MFNPLNNPLIVKTVLEKAEEELNESLKFRKKQFSNENLYMWVECDISKNLAYICLRNEFDENLVRMTAEELMEDKDIKEQMKKIPSIVRPFLNFKKIIPEMNQALFEKLGSSKFLKITEGTSKANIFLSDVIGKNLQAVRLYEMFS